MTEWYYAKGNDKHGPVSSKQLKQLARTGELLPNDLVWKEGAPDWKPAKLLNGLFPETKQAPKPPLPPTPPALPPTIQTDSSTPSKSSEKWYQHPATIVISLLFCFPVGLILIWTHRNWSINRKWTWTGGYAAAMLLLGLVNLGTDPGATGPAANNGDLQPTAISVTAEQFAKDYEANEVAADEKYKGNIVEVTGIIKEIGKDVFGNLYVSLENGQDLSLLSVDCYFDDNFDQQMASLSKGRQITIRGRCDSGNSIWNCNFMNQESAAEQERQSVDPAVVRNEEPTGSPVNSGESAAPKSAAVAPIVVTAERLSTDYSANEVAADEKYKNKIVEVTGTIREIGKDIFTNRTYVAIQVDPRLGFFSIECFIRDNLRQEAASLSKGSQITMRGRCKGKTADIKIENCEFVKIEIERDEGAFLPAPNNPPNGEIGETDLGISQETFLRPSPTLDVEAVMANAGTPLSVKWDEIDLRVWRIGGQSLLATSGPTDRLTGVFQFSGYSKAAQDNTASGMLTMILIGSTLNPNVGSGEKWDEGDELLKWMTTLPKSGKTEERIIDGKRVVFKDMFPLGFQLSVLPMGGKVDPDDVFLEMMKPQAERIVWLKEGGTSFKRRSDGSWEEKGRKGKTYFFKETLRTEEFIELTGKREPHTCYRLHNDRTLVRGKDGKYSLKYKGHWKTTNIDSSSDATTKRTARELTIHEFRAEIVGEDFTHAEFYSRFGKPQAIRDFGGSTFLFYICSDGKVRVECPKAPFHYDDDVAPVSVDYD